DTFSVPVKESTTVGFRLKALGDVDDVQVMIWSEKLKDNCRYKIGSLKAGQVSNVEFRAMEARVGWDMKGPSLEDDVLESFTLTFAGDENARLLLDDFEILR
ncbi:hypothetical protein MUP56_02620, partial [Patescibacteria group bacterium]|nr:hypothetical protein [Patescibacteria group bacterium]